MGRGRGRSSRGRGSCRGVRVLKVVVAFEVLGWKFAERARWDDGLLGLGIYPDGCVSGSGWAVAGSVSSEMGFIVIK